MWVVNLDVPKDVDVQYRYFVASIDPYEPSNVHIRKWETNLEPRHILLHSDPSIDVIDNFGVIDGVEKIDKGWLTNETFFQFKFYNNPFTLKDKIKNRLLHVKVINTFFLLKTVLKLLLLDISHEFKNQC